MKENDVFSLRRFGALLKQYVLHNYLVLLMGVAVVLGLTVLVTGFFKYVGGAYQVNSREYFLIFLFGYFILGGFYISMAFSAFRAKEKAFGYLMTPGSLLEKYLMELLFYPVLFLVAYPALFLLGYELSTLLVSNIRIEDFAPFDLYGYLLEVCNPPRFQNVDGTMVEADPLKMWRIYGAGALAVSMTFFLGAASFTKYPLLKTLLLGVIYIAFCAWAAYFFMGILEWGSDYHLSREDSYLAPLGTEGGNDQIVIDFFSAFLVLFGAVFSVVSFLKLKEKEV